MVILMEMGPISAPIGINVLALEVIAVDVPMRELSIGIPTVCSAILICLIIPVVSR